MSVKTTNYNLIKPDKTDFYDIGNQNTNMDIIDTELKNLNDTKATKVSMNAANEKITALETNKADKSEIPTSLPANGGNADTVGGKSPSEFATASHTHDDRYYTESEIDTKLNAKANSSHTHTKSQITDFPTSLPANGGNADTVDGFNAYQLQCLQNTGVPYGDIWMQSKWNGSCMDFYAVNSSGVSLGARVAEADTVDGYHVDGTLATQSLKLIYAGTSDLSAGVSPLSQGRIYIVYE